MGNSNNFLLPLRKLHGFMHEKSIAFKCKISYWKKYSLPIGKKVYFIGTPKILFEFEKIAVIEAEMYYYYQATESIMRSSWTPKRLDEFEALEERVKFFKANGFEKLYKLESYNLFYRFVGQIKQLKNSDSDEYKKKYEPIMRKMLKRKIRFYKKNWNDFNFKGNEWIYEQAYPELMRWYWIMNSVKNKILRKK